MNREIITLKGNNVEPNDLLDQRDKILDELSEYLPVTINIDSIGSANVSLGANPLVSGGVLADTLTIQNSLNVNDPADVMLTGPPPVNVNALITSGKMGGILDVGGNDPAKLTIRGLIEKLDTLASEIANSINTLFGRYGISSKTDL